MKWRIIISGKKSPSENMAIDEAIFLGNIEETSPPTIRFYDWNPPTASFGYNQKIKKELDLDLLEKKGYAFIKRPTGGRLVLHKDEITYAVIAPAQERLKGSITDSYSEISKPLALGLQNLGVNVEFEKAKLSSFSQKQPFNPFFTSSSRYELKYKNKKIVGSAQYRKNNCILQHGSILLNHNQSEVAYLLPNISKEQREKLSNYLSKKTACINHVSDKKYSCKNAVFSIINAFKQCGNDELLKEDSLNDTELIRIKELNRKFSSKKWNFNS